MIWRLLTVYTFFFVKQRMASFSNNFRSKQRLNNSSNEKGISSSQYQRGSFTARKERSLREAVQIKLKQTKTSLAGVVENLNPKMESLYGLIKVPYIIIK